MANEPPPNWPRFMLTLVFLLGGLALLLVGEGEAANIGGTIITGIGAVVAVQWGVFQTPPKGGGGAALLIAACASILFAPGCISPHEDLIMREAIEPSAKAIVERHDGFIREARDAGEIEPAVAAVILNESALFLWVIAGGEGDPPLSPVPPVR